MPHYNFVVVRHNNVLGFNIYFRALDIRSQLIMYEVFLNVDDNESSKLLN